MNFSGKRVLITGGGRRIGSALVRAFAEAGAEVIIHCNMSIDEAELLRRTLPNAEKHQVRHCDFSDMISVERLLAQVGRVDILVNCAALYTRKSLASGSMAEFCSEFTVNVVTPVSLMKQFVTQLENGEGVIVNILDQEVFKAAGKLGAYSLSKRALKDATYAAALEFAPRVRVNAVAPGPVLAPEGLEHLKMAQTLQSVPLARPVELADLVAGVLFLAGNRSITGEVLYVDGGQHLV
ncbi:MAG: SDR family oxidoreductase [Lentisphaeria bacterium]|nr:SDR family oxidoreductase [Lentisphaeria bacterium]